MIFIAHRGNIYGPNPDKENHPSYINTALEEGFDVEVDVWYENNKFILGHDKPQYEVSKEFLYNNSFWCHAKNIEAISQMVENPNFFNYFFHDSDDCVLTSQNYIWTYPRKKFLSKKSIIVVKNENLPLNWENAGGICSDFVGNLYFLKDSNSRKQLHQIMQKQFKILNLKGVITK